MLQRFPCDRGTLASPIMLQRAHAPERPCYYKPAKKRPAQKQMNNMCPTHLLNTCPNCNLPSASVAHILTKKTKINTVQNINK